MEKVKRIIARFSVSSPVPPGEAPCRGALHGTVTTSHVWLSVLELWLVCIKTHIRVWRSRTKRVKYLSDTFSINELSNDIILGTLSYNKTYDCLISPVSFSLLRAASRKFRITYVAHMIFASGSAGLVTGCWTGKGCTANIFSRVFCPPSAVRAVWHGHVGTHGGRVQGTRF